VIAHSILPQLIPEALDIGIATELFAGIRTFGRRDLQT
jgi:hypothetical protein